MLFHEVRKINNEIDAFEKKIYYGRREMIYSPYFVKNITVIYSKCFDISRDFFLGLHISCTNSKTYLA